MKHLELFCLSSIDHIVTPKDYENINLESSALTIFTDFRQFKPLVIEENTKAVDAQVLMEKTHVKLKVVVDEAEEFRGLITADDISNQQVIKSISNGFARSDLTVGDLMHARNELVALDFDEISSTLVMDVIETLKENGLKYCLVVDHQTNEIRGVIHADEIARKLKLSFEFFTPPTFAEIFKAVHS